MEGGFITPEEFNANFQFETTAMSQGWTYDATSPITNAYVACNLGNNVSSTYCNTTVFNQNGLPIGAGERLVPGKYTLYISAKDAVTASNTAYIKLYSNCGSYGYEFPVPLTNAWPTTAAGVFTLPVDFSAVTGGSACFLGVAFFGATTADQIQIGYFAFAPVAEQFTAQTINVTNLNGPGGVTGCAQSPVTGINNGYTCPTKGWSSTLTANENASQNSIAIASTAGLSPAGCFFVDGEYECYSGITGSTLTGLTRGAYLTTAASHNSGAAAISVNLVLGSTQAPPSSVLAYGGNSPVLLSVNNATPFNHGGASVLSINNGGNETLVRYLGRAAPAEQRGAEPVSRCVGDRDGLCI